MNRNSASPLTSNQAKQAPGLLVDHKRYRGGRGVLQQAGCDPLVESSNTLKPASLVLIKHPKSDHILTWSRGEAIFIYICSDRFLSKKKSPWYDN